MDGRHTGERCTMKDLEALSFNRVGSQECSQGSINTVCFS